MTSSQPPVGPDWADLIRWLAHSSHDDLLAIDDEWWLRSVVPVTDEAGFPIPDLGPGYLDEVRDLHREEMALLFAEAAELRIACRPADACLLGPRLEPWREARWRRRVHGRLVRAVRDGFEVPLGLMVCWAWPSARWLDADRLALASLSLETTETGQLVYARARLAGMKRGPAPDGLPEIEALLGRTRHELRSRASAWHAATRASLHEHRGQWKPALEAFLEASSDSGLLGAWVRTQALALALALGERDHVLGLRLAAPAADTRVVRRAQAEALRDVRLRLPRWLRARPASAPPVDRELFELIAGSETQAARVALQVVAAL